MDGKAQPQPVCAEEALDLLNCVAASAYDQDKCLLLLTNLRNCVLSKGYGAIGHVVLSNIFWLEVLTWLRGKIIR
ncbi:hypothetical protein QQ045_007927 [Rhodiola kirilowii]